MRIRNRCFHNRPDIIEGLVKNQAITSAVDDFVKDFEGLTGAGKTMSDC